MLHRVADDGLAGMELLSGHRPRGDHHAQPSEVFELVLQRGSITTLAEGRHKRGSAHQAGQRVAQFVVGVHGLTGQECE